MIVVGTIAGQDRPRLTGAPLCRQLSAALSPDPAPAAGPCPSTRRVPVRRRSADPHGPSLAGDF